MSELMEAINFEAIVKPMEGWCTPQKAKRLYELVLETDSQLSVELGVFGGRSLVPMGIAHKAKGSGFVIGIDAWNNKVCIEGNNDPANNEWWMKLDMRAIYNSCRYYMDLHQLDEYCETLRMRSNVAVLFQNNTIDILHQDSNHNAETILTELKLWIPKVKVGGYWVVDDTDWKEAKEGYDHLNEFGLVLVEDHVKWQIWKKVK